MTSVPPAPADEPQRVHALDIGRSVIVQAPAGSGKTDLLTRRFLRLLAVVDEPEEILAITFTRAATAEMRARILDDLEAAATQRNAAPEDAPRLELARAALAHAESRGWNILNHPRRLAVETIDSLCLRIAQERPLLSGPGGRLQPTEEVEPLHALAAHRTLEHLGGSDQDLHAALAHFLDLRDNQLSDCEDLLAKMLAGRDQWQRVLPLSREMTEEDWDVARVHLQRPFQREIARVLEEAYRQLAAEPLIAKEVLALANYACANGNQEVALLAEVVELSPSMSVDHWNCICNLVLTKSGDWRRRVQAKQGFPTQKKGGAEAKHAIERMGRLLVRLGQIPGLLPALCAIRDLPPGAYSEEQWDTLRHVLTVLRRAVAELKVVFAEKKRVDFTELNLAALEVLKDSPDRLTGIGPAIRHLLIDEFQDTSALQHEILEALIAAWDLSEHRTCFLVGDPMQSIYLFRQAEVEIFSDVWERGIGPDDNRISCDPLQLSVNFRSHRGLTTPVNRYFSAIGDEPAAPGSAAVRFAPATPASTEASDESVFVHPQIVGDGNGRPSQEEILTARRQEAVEVLHILERQLPLIEKARKLAKEYRVAVLVRARPHLDQIVPLLRRNGIPFRAVEIEQLSARQELLDLQSLTRALLHPMDRIAWLSVLRAPWCGLTLSDLHRLTGSDDPEFAKRPIPELIEQRGHLLSPDGQQRLARTSEILKAALKARWSGQSGFASWIERTWRTLRGPECLDAAALENAQTFFALLDSVAPDGLAPMTAQFDAELDRLFAQPDPAVSERYGIQLMTIHKAKGLGFEVVIVPGLDRNSSADKPSLLVSLARRNPWHTGEDEFLVAPIGPKGDDSDPLYKWVSRQRNLRFDEERKRLFYVACTRARHELHLLGTAILGADGLKAAESSSLLATAWPALQQDFETHLRNIRNRPAVQKMLEFPAPGVIEELAAGAGSSVGPRRVPSDFDVQITRTNVAGTGTVSRTASEQQQLRRPEGTRRARMIGSVIHAMLQRLGSGLAGLPDEDLRLHAAALIRGFGLTGESQASATEAVLAVTRKCGADPVCRWILSQHPDALSEASWSGFAQDSRLRTLRADRVFRAGPEPVAPGDECHWVIDYKTGTPDSKDRQHWLAHQRHTYAPQLTAYGSALRAMRGKGVALRLGIYYPALAVLDWWDPDALTS